MLTSTKVWTIYRVQIPVDRARYWNRSSLLIPKAALLLNYSCLFILSGGSFPVISRYIMLFELRRAHCRVALSSLFGILDGAAKSPQAVFLVVKVAKFQLDDIRSFAQSYKE